MMANRRGYRKKGVFFSIDSLIAVFIILLGVMIAFPLLKGPERTSFVQEDVLKSFSSIEIGDLQSSYVQGLINDGTIVKLENSVLEQIAEFYVFNRSLARDLAEDIFSELDLDENVGIWFANDLVAYHNSTPYEGAREVKSASQIISGIRDGESVTAYSGRAFLQNSLQSDYFYFGGYVGEGNLSALIEYDGNISSASMELVAGEDFDVYVNGVFQGRFRNSSSRIVPSNYTLSTTNFHSGTNLVELVAPTLNIAGGFIKVSYEPDVSYEQPKRYYFPGISGVINLYDGFFVPGNLTNLEIFLGLNSSFSFFLKVGNVTVFEGNTSGAENLTINNSYLSSVLDYDNLWGKTVPLRMGMHNATYIGGDHIEADVFSVTDLSGSMDDDCASGCEADCGSCTDQTCGICNAKYANGLLIGNVINYSGNRIGLVGYEATARESDYHPLTSNPTLLSDVINNEWDADGGTCICCGINKMIEGFNKSVPVINGGRIESRVSASYDDAEESLVDGEMRRTSSDLDMVYDDYYWNRDNQEVGLRFRNINIPQGSSITRAYIEFEGDANDYGTSHLTFSGQDADNAPEFGSNDYNITGRTKTSAKVTWSNIPYWYNNGDYETPDLSSVIQEVVDRAGWSSGNSLVILINGSGAREAEPYDGESSYAPNLVIEYDNTPATCGDGNIDAGEVCDDGNTNNNDNCTNYCTVAVCGDGVLWTDEGGNETCDDGGYCSGDNLTVCSTDGDCLGVGGTCVVTGSDGCDENCTIDEKLKIAVVMSDGYANAQCSEQGTGNAGSDAVQAACDAFNDHGIMVHAVGFGSNVDETTLQSIASCGNGSYYYSSVDELAEIYAEISEDIIRATFYEQTLIVDGELFSELMPYSYIEFDYDEPEVPYGLITTVERDFMNNSYANFSIPENSTVLDVRAVSYSGSLWTDFLSINNTPVYNLTEYGEDYIYLGDPYPIHIPNSEVGDYNLIHMTTALTPDNRSNASEANKVILTLATNFSAYATLSGLSDGCNWELEFEDNTFLSEAIPEDYSGTDDCYYVSSGQNISNSEDAMQVSVMNLLKSMDHDLDGLIDVKFGDQDLKISSSELSGIPYDWSTEVQVRLWR